jgi:threonine dehydrogenase-like Zn-dependent dehydrogenase
MSARIAKRRGYRMIGIDLVPERLRRGRDNGIEVLDLQEHKDIAGMIREMTDGRGTDSVIDAVGMEAHGDPVGKIAQQMAGLLPDAVAAKLMEKAGLDRLSALYLAIDVVRRGGTISLIGVYAGMVDPIAMLTLVDKQIQFRMGKANVMRWIDEIMPFVIDPSDPLGVETFATHRVPLTEAPRAYEKFQKKQDGVVKVLFQP